MTTRSGDIKNRGVAGGQNKKGECGPLKQTFFQKIFFLSSSWIISQTTIVNQNQFKTNEVQNVTP